MSLDSGQHSAYWHGKKLSLELINLARWWGITSIKPRRLYKLQPTEGFRLCFTLHYSYDSKWMIFIIITWHILCFQMQSLPVQCPEGSTDVHKYIPQTFDGLELFQWHPEVKQMRPSHCCLHGTVFHQLVFVIMTRRWSKAIFFRSSKMLHVSWNSWSHILPGKCCRKRG